MPFAAKTISLSAGPDFGGANEILDGRYPDGAWPGTAFIATAQAPFICGSDIVSGPSAGLDDGLGQGVIVTLWGWGFGSSQGSSAVYFTDSTSTKRGAAHIYYWKKADGTAPGGPIDLWRSHYKQEICFSIPTSADGAGSITVETAAGVSNTLTFTVRAGNIFWVAPTGKNANPGTYASPKAFINGNIAAGANTGGFGDAGLAAGDFVYSRGVQEPAFSSGGIECGFFLRGLPGTAASPISLIAYPGNTFSRIEATHHGQSTYLTTGVVTSKYVVAVGNRLATDTSAPDKGISNESNYHIQGSKWGRAIGCLLIERDGYTINGQSGCVVATADRGESFVAMFNHLKDLGNDYTSHFQHATYLSIRDSGYMVTTPPEFSYNFIENNRCHDAIHYYDQASDNSLATAMTGTIRIVRNVVVNCRSAGVLVQTAGISGYTGAIWNVGIYIVENMFKNVGLGPLAEPGNGVSPYAIKVGGQINATTVTIDRNTVYGFSDAVSQAANTPACLSVDFSVVDPTININNNLLYGIYDVDWLLLGPTTTVNSGDSNLFFSSAATQSKTAVPSGFTNSITTDPKIYDFGYGLAVDSASPAIGTAVSPEFSQNIYGASSNTNIGAI